MNKFIKFGIGAALAVTVAWVGVSRGGDQERGAGDFTLNKTGDLYSLEARGAALSDVLAKLNELSGLNLEVDPKLGTTVTTSLKDVELEKVLAAVSSSRALVYEEQADKSYKLVEARLTSQQAEIEQPAKAIEKAQPGSDVLGAGVLTNTKKPIGELRARGSRAILLQNAVIDTDAARRGEKLSVPAQFAAPWDAEYQIVQFDHAVSDADRQQLADLGIEVAHYVPNSAYAVRVTPEQLASLQNLSGVAYVEPYHPYFKMSRDILAVMTGVEDELATARMSAGEFNALSFRGSHVADAIVAAGGEIVGTQTVDGRERVTFRMDAAKLPEVLALSSVQWVEPDVRPTPMNDLSSQRIHARSLRQLHPTLTGEGVTIGMTDTGIDFYHRVFALDPANPTSTNLNTRIAAYYTREGGPSDGIPGDNNGHGTHVAGIILGNGAFSDTVIKAPGSGTAPYGTNQFAGVAPAAKIVVIENYESFTDAEQAELTVSSGARISNNSWGNPFYEYGSRSAAWDALVLDANTNVAGRQPLIAFFAAGNYGGGNNDGTGGIPSTIGEPGNAKNVITIGAVEQRRKADNLSDADEETDSDWQIAGLSSRGPVSSADLRAKPDLVAPGSYVLSAQSRDTMPDELEDPFGVNRDYRYSNLNSGTNYAFFSGTSVATPVASGAGALFYQYYTNAFGVAPSPAMMKAALVAGARMVNSLAYSLPRANSPSSTVDQGFGLIDVKRSVDGPGHRPTDKIEFFDEAATGAIGTEETYSHQVTLGAGEGGLKIVLAWSDIPGTPGNAAQLVNDLDLIVIPPGGGAYLGNQLDYDGVSARKFEGPDPLLGDRYNNVETIVISDAPIGTYTIRVRGYEVPSVEKQPFALVVMKGIGIEGRTEGDSVAMALDTNSRPVIAYAAFDAAGQKQIYVKHWVGPYGDFSELGNWWRMDDQWAGYRYSAVKTGISRTLEDSEEPSIAVDGDNVFVAWRERPRDIGGTNVNRIFVRQWDGSNWNQLGGSAQDFGVPNSESYNTFSPQIGVMSNGRPVVAWLQYSDTTTNLIHPRVAVWDGANWVGLANSHSNGLAMSSTNTVNVSDSLSLTINQQGNPVVAWKESRINNSISVRQWNGASWQSINYSNSLFYIHSPKITAAKRSSDLYLAWRQQISAPLPYASEQIFAARRTGGTWGAMGGSTTHPGISSVTNGQNVIYPFEPSISVGEVEGITNVYVSWRAGNSNGNFILVKQWRAGQSSWSSTYGAGSTPGVDIWPEQAAAPVSAADRYGLPIVSFALSNDTRSAIATYTVIADRSAPVFAGLQSAAGGTNSNVFLTWLPAVDDISTTIYYRIYRSTAGVACGTPPVCDETNVFGNLIATVTNLTSFTVTGLTPNQIYCFGVRAVDTNGQVDANTVIRSAGPVSGTGDNDGDCLPNALEIAAGTEPCVIDTDGDGMWDGWEWTFSTNNVNKTNSISIWNTNKVYLSPIDNGTDNIRTSAANDGDPINHPDADPDGDGASNYEEFLWWLNNGASCAITNIAIPAGPNPTAWDTDGDGMPDGWEMINGLNPIDPSDAALDADGDGLNNLDEYHYGTDPNNTDSDGDGLTDGAEVGTYGTNPALADSDGDGLDDGYEVAIGTDPARADTDHNFLSDGDAVQLGLNPLSGTPAYNNLLFETFEATSGTRAAWTHYALSGSSLFDMWHLSTAEPAPSTGAISIAYFGDRSTSTAYRAAFDPSGTNVNANYSLGSALAMALQSPTFSNQATTVSNLFVAWAEYYETEPDFDQTIVQVRSLPDTNWINVSQAMSGMSGVTNVNQSTQTARWVYRVADASQFAGKSNVQVRFLFSIKNAINNSYRGWWVDDVRVYEGTSIKGWVRDINGRAVQGATVRAMGKGGVTNRLNGHSYVLPGKVFSEVKTAVDGSYSLAGLPAGNFYLKASAEGYIAEFYDGLLFTNQYAFGNGFRPGVFNREYVSANGIISLLTLGTGTNAYFELEPGQGVPRLGIVVPNAGSLSYPTYLDGRQLQLWNGSTGAPALTDYLSSPNVALQPNFPDWLTNAVAPTFLLGVAPGPYNVYAGTNLPFYPQISVDLREGESTKIIIATNQASGRISVSAASNRAYNISIDGRVLTNLTPSVINVLAGPHEVSLVPTGSLEHITLKSVNVPIGGMANVTFSEESVAGAFGHLFVSAVDPFGNGISDFTVLLNGSPLTTNDFVGQLPGGNSLTITTLRPGSHNIAIQREGYRATSRRIVSTFSAVTNSTQFVLYESDVDFDRVGDALEIEGYTNIFLYHRDHDPDADGLSNLQEFDLFRKFGIRLDVLNADTDSDGATDGEEVGYDGITNRFAYSSLYSTTLQFAPEVQALFVGSYLAGIDNFGTGTGKVVSIAGDRFVGDIYHPLRPVPSKEPALTVFTNVTTFPSNTAVSAGHVLGTPIFADLLPHMRDTDDDGMWDGFEYQYGIPSGPMDPLDNSDAERDSDFDGLSNLNEFLGTDHQANTNDWTNPGKADTDGDYMPDGWEYQYGLDPNDPSDAYTDLDGDGLINLAEFLAGTSPVLRDTDADFLGDYEEVMIYGTDPNNPDTDSDGLLDGREVWDKDMDGIRDGGFFPMWNGGDLDGDGLVDGPTDWDTDGDGMPDGFEVLDNNGNIRPPNATLNPYDPTDGDEDADGDGLSNLQEYLVRDALFGNHPTAYARFDSSWNRHVPLGWQFPDRPFAYPQPVWDYSTDPFNADTDGDGMPDGFEVLGGLHPMDPLPSDVNSEVLRYPLLGIYGDPDEDGLWNEAEYKIRYQLDGTFSTNSALGKSTSPWIADSDGDGVVDGFEHHALFGNPTEQDTDGDRLMDGVAVPGKWGEINTERRADYAIFSCPTCTWTDARSIALATAHPNDPAVFGDLAVVSDYPELLKVQALLTGSETNVALGMYDPRGTGIYSTVTGEPFVFQYFADDQPQIIPSETNIVYMRPDGFWAVAETNAIMDHFIVEWNISTTTNHYDQAVNDIWELVWPLADYVSRPYWRQVEIATNSPVPPARWGSAMVYNPTYERKTRKFDGTYAPSRYYDTATPVLDGRKLIVVGGVDGVDRYSDIWEFNIRSNEWRRSVESLVTPSLARPALQDMYSGLSDFGAVLLHGYLNTKLCAPSDKFWNEDGEGFGEPKNRPWNFGFKESSFDMTYMIGGWNDQNKYLLPEPIRTFWYKSTDDPDTINELNDGGDDSSAFSAAYGLYRHQFSNNVLAATTYTNGVAGFGRLYQNTNEIPVGTYEATYTAVENAGPDRIEYELSISNRAAGVRFSKFPFVFPCDGIAYAGLRLDISRKPSTGTVFTVYAEYDNVDRTAKPYEDGGVPLVQGTVPVEFDHPITRIGRAYNSTPLDVLFTNYIQDLGYGVQASSSASELLEIDVTPIVNELILSGNWRGEAIGFVIVETNGVADYALFRDNNSRLRVEWVPSYKIPPVWGVGSRIQTENATQVPSQRKSFGMVYAHKNNRVVVFGGINGRQALGDTYEGRLRAGDSDDEDEELEPGNPAQRSVVRYVPWQRISTPVSPPARWGHAMVYDETHGDVLMFGGFDANNQPLNDLWVYTPSSVQTNTVVDEEEGSTNITTEAIAGSWTQITALQDGQRPSPRGGAMFAYYGGEFYTSGAKDEYRSTRRDRFVLFGGTDGKNYYNDTWVFYREFGNFVLESTTGNRWTLVDPGGEQSRGPSPRAFGSMSYAQNGGDRPDPLGFGQYLVVDGTDRRVPASATVFLFGGRTGTLPAGTDTDRDLVPDGQEHELGGTDAGRDPRVNALVNPDAGGLETVPYNIKRLGTWIGGLSWLQRSHVADLEVLSYPERVEAWRSQYFTWQGWPIETSFTNENYVVADETQVPFETPDPDRLVYATGVDALVPDWTNMWYHRYPLGYGDPRDPRDAWELGIPAPMPTASNSAPPYAYSGRWVYGTRLTGPYPRDAIMELYSPIFDTRAPDPDSTHPDNTNPYFLMFHEWVDLADSNDVIRVDIVRPGSPADVNTRVSGLDRPTIPLIPNRNNAANTQGKWRRVIVPLNIVGNDSNLYARFTLQSDTNTLVAGGWYIDDIAVLQGAEISGMLAAGTNTDVCLIGENFNDNIIDCTVSESSGLFQFGLLPLGNYQVVAAGVTNGPYVLADSTLDVDLTMADVQFTDIAPGLGNTAAIITWSATNGAAYQLDYTTNLLTGPWTFLYSVTSGVDTTLSYTDLFSTADRIYRVAITNAP